METETNQEAIYDLYKLMQVNNLNYIYRGIFTNSITKRILSIAESSLFEKDESSIVKKKIYNIMIEGLQNISKHQADDKIEVNNNYGIFTLKKEFCKYFISTGNLIENNKIEELSLKIEKINNLNKDELKKYYTEILIHGRVSKKGGAGLGLIGMIRKSNNKLIYSFDKIDDVYSYFYLHSEIISPKSREPIIDIKTSSNSNYHNRLHKILNNENVIFSFYNDFDESSMMSLLSMIENKIDNSVILKKRVYNIMVEMFQNIIKHGDDYEMNNENKSGLFYISENDNEFLLNTGNYIKNSKVKSLKDKINYVNSLLMTELNNFYNDKLLDFNIDTNKGAGLGFIDLRMRTNNQLKYEFIVINNEFSFFTLRSTISKL